MSIRLEINGQTEQLILDQIKQGTFGSPDEVVDEAVRLLSQKGSQVTRQAQMPRQGGQWKGLVQIRPDFDELPADLQEAFGMRDA